MHIRTTSLLAWLLCGIIVAVSLFGTGRSLLTGEMQSSPLKIAGNLFSTLLPIVFAFVAAFIISRQPRNVLGWLLLLPPLAFPLDIFVQSQLTGVTTPPPEPSALFLVAVFLSNALWLLLILPVLLIALLFPTGRPLSPRWRWVVIYALGLTGFFVAVAAFADSFGPDPGSWGVNWTVPNPLGFLSGATIGAILFPWWGIGLAALAFGCVISLFLRYRRAAAVERQQIKWLLYAVGMFTAFYAPGLLTWGNFGWAQDLFNLLFPLLLLGFPIAIGIAILRYRLFDIDVIIRRTVTYALVTAVLGVIFFGSVILLQQLFSQLTGPGQNELVTVLSTLAIAALFVPVRNRIQNTIDRRFNRKKYDAQQVLNDFAQTARDETDLEKLTGRLIEVVDETMQPKSVSLWLKTQEKRRHTADNPSPPVL